MPFIFDAPPTVSEASTLPAQGDNNTAVSRPPGQASAITERKVKAEDSDMCYGSQEATELLNEMFGIRQMIQTEDDHITYAGLEGAFKEKIQSINSDAHWCESMNESINEIATEFERADPQLATIITTILRNHSSGETTT